MGSLVFLTLEKQKKRKKKGRCEIMTNILVIDDVSLIRLKLEKILKNEGFTVFEAANIASVKNNMFAEEDISLKEIDLVLLDIYLKEENGLNLLEHLTQNYPGVKVVIISVEAKKSVVQKAIDLGAKDYITKPFDQKILLKKLYSLIPDQEIEEMEDKDTEKYHDKFKKNIDLLKTSISLELNRALRSKKPFSLVKMEFSKKLNKNKKRKLKEVITGKIRNIDQIFHTNSFKYIFLLPLTDKKGREVFIEKIIEQLNVEDNQIKLNSMSFPDLVLEGDEDQPEHENLLKYKKQILQKVFDNVVSLKNN